MKPTLLKMTAFGSYAKETVIDFSKLGNEGLYLICGDTGAGKTTIFDAICFALFGEPSGNERKISMMHSEYVPSTTPSKVELSFIYRNETYTVTRCFTENKAISKKDVQFQGAGKIIVGKREVDSEIEALLGLTRDQFTRIVMIAQGDFLKVLTAKTDERQKIFRGLFKTGIYQKFQDRVQKDASAAGNEYSAKCDAETACREHIDFPENSDNSELFREYMQTGNESGLIQLTEQLISEDKARERNCRTTIEQLAQELRDVNIALGKAHETEKNRQRLNSSNAALESKSKELESLRKKKEEQENNKPVIEQLSKEISVAETRLPMYEQRDRLCREINICSQNINALNGEITSAASVIHNMDDELNQLESEFQELSDTESETAVQQSLVESLRSRYNELNSLKKQLDGLSELSKEADYSKKHKQNAEILYKNDYEQWMNYNRLYIESQSFYLAKNLKEGMPCPVCGSTTHPRPAVDCHNTVSWEQVEQAQKKYTLSKAEFDRRAADYSAKAGALENSHYLISEKANEINIESNPEAVNSALEDITKQGLEARKRLDQLQQRTLRRKDLSELIPIKRKSLEKINSDTFEMKRKLTAEQTALTEKQQQCDGIVLPFYTKKEAERSIEEIRTKKSELECNLQLAADNYSLCEKEISALNAAIETLKESIRDAEAIDIDGLNKRAEELNNRSEQIQNEYNSISQRRTANEKNLSLLIAAVKARQAAERRYIMLDELRKTACGADSENGKIRLEAYIQTMYLDRITARANHYLLNMTGGQYSLHRTVEASDKRSQTGLELSVADALAGGELRSVNTLSGGESFMASLALALGLSEEVQSSAGGIEISAMFVDEGFGSLDGNALELSVKSLQSLSAGNRLVGIISHVEELKEMIDKKIIVTKLKSGEGSTAEIVSPN